MPAAGSAALVGKSPSLLAAHPAGARLGWLCAALAHCQSGPGAGGCQDAVGPAAADAQVRPCAAAIGALLPTARVLPGAVPERLCWIIGNRAQHSQLGLSVQASLQPDIASQPVVLGNAAPAQQQQLCSACLTQAGGLRGASCSTCRLNKAPWLMDSVAFSHLVCALGVCTAVNYAQIVSHASGAVLLRRGLAAQADKLLAQTQRQRTGSCASTDAQPVRRASARPSPTSRSMATPVEQSCSGEGSQPKLTSLL